MIRIEHTLGGSLGPSPARLMETISRYRIVSIQIVIITSRQIKEAALKIDKSTRAPIIARRSMSIKSGQMWGSVDKDLTLSRLRPLATLVECPFFDRFTTHSLNSLL